jgi:hypothetical protein
MDTNITSVGINPPRYAGAKAQPHETPQTQPSKQQHDVLELGRGTLTLEEVQQILGERILEKVRAALEEVWKSRDLQPEVAVPDMSAEATAGRIADFAEGGFQIWRTNHADMEEDTARKTYAEFIGKAVNQGIKEARQVFEALEALQGKTSDFVDTVERLVNERLEAFGKPREAEIA